MTPEIDGLFFTPFLQAPISETAVMVDQWVWLSSGVLFFFKKKRGIEGWSLKVVHIHNDIGLLLYIIPYNILEHHYWSISFVRIIFRKIPLKSPTSIAPEATFWGCHQVISYGSSTIENHGAPIFSKIEQQAIAVAMRSKRSW